MTEQYFVRNHAVLLWFVTETGADGHKLRTRGAGDDASAEAGVASASREGVPRPGAAGPPAGDASAALGHPVHASPAATAAAPAAPT